VYIDIIFFANVFTEQHSLRHGNLFATLRSINYAVVVTIVFYTPFTALLRWI